jgi:uncharacterized protein YndB with AHSA1/START domain
VEKSTIERSIWINAPRERVWQAITDPAQIQQWFSPTTPWVLTAMAVGGQLYANGYESQTGIIELIDAPRQFTYRWGVPTSDTTFSVTTSFALEEENGGTRVRLIETFYETVPGTVREKGLDQNSQGWAMALENLKAYLDGKALPYPEGF